MPPHRTALLAAAVLCGQASVGWANDHLDAPLDRAARRASKPVVAGDVGDRTVARAAAAALLLTVPLSLTLGPRAAAAHLVAVGSAWLYDTWLKPTLLSPVPYAVAFALLPTTVALALPGAPLPRPSLVAAGGVLGLAAHFANTVPDTDADRLTGMRGLPQRIGPDLSTVLASGFVAVAAGLLVGAAGGAPAAVVAAAAAVAVAAACPVVVLLARRRAAAFGLVLAAVGLLVTAFVVSGGERLVA